MGIKLFLLIITVEALVQLWMKAGPLQKLRQWLIRSTPFLYIEGQGNLFNCPYCMSVWTGIVLLPAFYFFGAFEPFVIFIVLHRASNYVHLIYSFLNDKQMDLRIARNKK